MTTTAAGRAALTVLVGAGVYVACFPRRLEYPAHFLAGAGVASMALAVSSRWRGPVELRVVAVVAWVVVAATVAELTFAGPRVDLLDIANTIAGGALAMAAVLGARAPGRRRTLAVAGAALVVAGLAVRYQVQSTVKHWWWLGP